MPHEHATNADTSAPTGPTRPLGTLTMPPSIGPYRLLSVLGEGGFGVVYLAEQTEPIQRRLALKVLKPGMNSASVLARFELERRALALMNHPNVARVFDAGQTELGLPYVAMEVVQGHRITEYCDAHRLSIHQRVELLATVCDAVQHAHTKGIIHRDLKPSNILVEEVDGRPTPKVIDFGVAKAIAAGDSDAERTLFTERGVLIGTPEYMPPEQARSGMVDVDTRADVYSLGVVLYELLAGALPHAPESLRNSDYAEVLRILREEEPPSPARRLSDLHSARTAIGPTPPIAASTPAPPDARVARAPVAAAIAIAEARGTDVASLIRLLKGEIGWIPLKAMRKSREERYRSAAEFADDLRNYLASRPLIAGPETAGYRLRKFARRHRTGVLAGAGVTLALMVGIAGTTLGFFRARHALKREEVARKVVEGSLERERTARTLAEQQRDRADTVASFMREVFRGVGPQVSAGRDTTLVRHLMDEAAGRINNGELRGAPEAEMALRLTVGGVYRSLADFDAAGKMTDGAQSLSTSAEWQGPLLLEKGMLLWDQGDPTGAEPLLERALIQMRASAQTPPIDLLIAISALAGVRDALGRAEEAHTLYAETLEKARELHDGDNNDLASAMSNLARARQNLGDLTGAMEMHQAAYEMYQRLNVGDDPDFAATANNLAICKQALGHSEEAERLFDESLAMRRRIYPPNHPEVAQGMSNLAFVKIQRGQAEEAEKLLEQAVEIRRAAFPGDHPAITKSLSNLAAAKRSLKKMSEAEALYNESLAMLKRLFPEGHPDTAVNLSNLASTVSDQGRPAEAEPLLIESLAMLRSLRPDGDMDTILVLRKLAIVRDQLARYEESAETFIEAIALARAVLGAEHLEVVRGLHGLAKCQLKGGRPEDARRHAAEALALGEKLLPAGHAGLADLRKTLADAEAPAAGG